MARYPHRHLLTSPGGGRAQHKFRGRGSFAFGSDTVFGVNAISQEHGSGGRGCMVFQNGRWHRQR